MAKVRKEKSNKDNNSLPKVFIAPTTNEASSCPLRIKEIQDLVAEIVVLGLKRGRPARNEMELKDVA